MENMKETVTCYRPTGPNELKLVAELNWTRWPPRLEGQPIFYPVTNQEYAEEIAEKWNVPASGSGYVTRFEVQSDYLEQFEIQKVGGLHHTEWWVPSEELETFNDHIVGQIEVVRKFPDDAPDITG
jgi:hypothetical protein